MNHMIAANSRKSSKTVGVHLKPPFLGLIKAIASRERRSISSVIALIVEEKFSQRDDSRPEIDIPLTIAFKSGSEQPQSKEASNDR